MGLGGRGIIGGIMGIIIMVIEWVLRWLVVVSGREVVMGARCFDRFCSSCSIGKRASGRAAWRHSIGVCWGFTMGMSA